MTKSVLPSDYKSLLGEIKERIRSAQYAALKAVNKELIAMYWDIGRSIVLRQRKGSWGKSVVERLSSDLRGAFPSTIGFSARNLWDMRRFYAEYHQDEELRQLVAEIPWGQNLLILNRIKDRRARHYYLQALHGRV